MLYLTSCSNYCFRWFEIRLKFEVKMTMAEKMLTPQRSYQFSSSWWIFHAWIFHRAYHSTVGVIGTNFLKINLTFMILQILIIFEMNVIMLSEFDLFWRIFNAATVCTYRALFSGWSFLDSKQNTLLFLYCNTVMQHFRPILDLMINSVRSLT